jgi:FkbM family methyltransferase
MTSAVKSLIQRLGRSLGLGLTSPARLDELREIEGDVDILLTMIEQSVLGFPRQSQLGQDVFVLLESDFKRNGFFVEFGATNGIDLSNTYILEKHYGWTGILAEPAPIWHEGLIRNRAAAIDFDCVWSETGEELAFNIAPEPELSTISAYSGVDQHSAVRKRSSPARVKTISLNDLLKKHHAPPHIDYLSIDTEGSEWEILRNLDFDTYSFSIITCEHNYSKHRDDIYHLLSSKGYTRTLKGISKFDDWYVRRR